MAKTLILAGCFCLAFSGYLYKQRYNPVRLAISSYKKEVPVAKEEVKIVKKTPVSIQIESIGVHLPMLPAKITKEGWETTSQGVSYLTSSPVPGNDGNSILYGHNWPSLLGNLVRIKPGDNIRVYYSDGTFSEFIVEKTDTVAPDQMGILDQTSDKRITIYTCTGFLDSKRFVAVALLKNN